MQQVNENGTPGGREGTHEINSQCRKNDWLLRMHAGFRYPQWVGSASRAVEETGVAFRRLLRNDGLQVQQGVEERKQSQGSLSVWVCGPRERKAELKSL